MQWHKTFNYEWLTGSIRKDLSPAGRSVWADILATAGLARRQGYLERGHGVPWTTEELAAFWCTPLDIVTAAFEACLKEGRLTKIGETYFVTNFEKYQSKTSKIVAKEIAIDKAKRTKKSMDNAVVGLTRAVNEQTKATIQLEKRIDNIPNNAEIAAFNKID